MTIPWLALRSLRDRRLTSALTVATIGLSVALIVGVINVQRSARASFAGVVSGTDLIVGPRGGAVELLLYAVFHLGSPTANLSYDAYRRVAEHPAVAWTIPLSLGDSHRGYRVVATNEDFYARYRFHGDQAVALRAGRFPDGLWDVAVGSAVADALGYEIGQPIVVSHGLASTGFLDHDDRPFELVGILAPTGTPIDRSVFVTLQGFEAMHLDWQSGAPPRPDEATPAEAIRAEDLEIRSITAFLLGTTSRIETLQLQRELNTAEGEPLTAVIPGVALAELWRVVGYAEGALLVVSVLVVTVGLLGLLMTVFASLEARRREMAILRALGVGPRGIVGLLVLEATLLAVAGCALGIAAFYALLAGFQPVVQRELGLHVPLSPLGAREWALLAAVVVAAALAALLPALKAYRTALHDGLVVRS